ncbi:MAG: hypothetical protein QOK37_4621 [Thermoanaerobaculia bacterium]|jgi:hypothetical protein|nr:hypothetical protein [Thermoanaerobaculia bacterium]
MTGEFRDLRRDAFILLQPRCPCYCGGEGFLVLEACPSCDTLVGRCDEVDELIRDLRNPTFDPENSICHPDVACPNCGVTPFGEFRAATEAEIRAIGIAPERYRRWYTQ